MQHTHLQALKTTLSALDDEPRPRDVVITCAVCGHDLRMSTEVALELAAQLTASVRASEEEARQRGLLWSAD